MPNVPARPASSSSHLGTEQCYMNHHNGYRTFFQYATLDRPAPPMRTYDYIIKIAVCGEHRAGKSCFVKRFLFDDYEHQYVQPTRCIAFHTKMLTLAGVASTGGASGINVGRTVLVHIWDMSGEDRWHPLWRRYLARCHAVLLFYDLASRHGMTTLVQWLHMLGECTEAGTLALRICAMRADIAQENWQTMPEEVRRMLGDYGLSDVGRVWQVSALSGLNVYEVVIHACQEVINERRAKVMATRFKFYKPVDEILLFTEDKKFMSDFVIQVEKDATALKNRGKCKVM